MLRVVTELDALRPQVPGRKPQGLRVGLDMFENEPSSATAPFVDALC